MLRRPFCSLLVAAPLMWTAAAAARADDPPGGPTVASGHRQVLLQATQSWNGKPYTRYPAGQPQLTMLRLEIAPHTALPWHTHPFPNAGYVLSGALTITDRHSGKSQTFQQGQAFAESVDDEHRGMDAGDTPTVLILVYSGVPGTPTSIPSKGQKAEY